jgi:hypothetical protein
MSEKIWHGFWWLPGEESRIPGTLQVHESGETLLTLIGSFDLDKNAPSPTSADLTIFGLSGPHKITLISGYASLTTQWEQEISGSRALIGSHIFVTGPAFSSVMLTLENLGTFLDRHSFRQTGVLAEEPASVVFDRADEIVFTAEGWKFKVYTYFPGFQSRTKRGSTVVDGKAQEVLIATSDVPRPLSDFDEITKAFMDLLTLASGEACGVTEMSLEPAQNANFPRGDARGYERVEDHGKWIHTASPDALPQQSLRFRFTCSDMSFEDITRAWLPLRRDAISATNLLFGLYYSPGGFTETRVLSAAVVVESLHTILFDKPLRWEKEEFDVLQAAIASSIVDPVQQKWIAARIKNEKSFKERLIQLASFPDQVAVDAVIGDVNKWTRRVMEARNGLAHVGAEGRRSGDIFELTQSTMFLACLVLMEKLGLSGEVQVKAYERNEYLSTVRPKPPVAVR